MKKLALRKEIFRSFKKSKSRFFSIVCLMALGSFALVGLKVTGPDMRVTGSNYFQDHHTADLSIIADYGLNQEDVNIINQASAKDIEYGYLKDVTIKNEHTAVRLFSKTERISTFDVKEGRLPKSKKEIALQENLKKDYAIGDSISFHEKKDLSGNTTLNTHTFTIVGFVNSTEIISNVNQGASTAGTGDLSHYAVISTEAFDSDIFMIARLTYEDIASVDPYSDTYATRLLKHKEELNELLADQPKLRLQSVKADVQRQLDEGNKNLLDAQQTFDNTKEQLANAKLQIEQGELELANKQAMYNQAIQDGQVKLNDARNTLRQSETTLTQAKNAYQNNLTTYQAKLQTYNESKPQLEAAITSLKQQETTLQAVINDPTATDQQKAEASATLQVVQANLTAYTQQLTQATTAIENAKVQLEQADRQIRAGEVQLQQGQIELQNQEAGFETKKTEGANQLTQASATLQESKTTYQSKQAEFDEKRSDIEKELANAKSKLSQYEDSLDSLELPAYAIQSRKEAPGSQGYKIYGSIATIVDSLANVFPIFLYFVAALVTFTTMTRFVDEDRINLGTLKALGYENKDIRKKFTVYGLLAGTIGTFIGTILGHTLLPAIVYKAYSVGFTVPPIEFHFYFTISLIALILSLLSAVLPAYMVASRELKNRPSILLQPKSPKAGSKILLERIRPLWSRLSFTHKVTARNLFRYKKRAFMTIFGVCGAVTMLFAGFGMQHSISGIGDHQFGEIITYDMIIAKDPTIQQAQSDNLEKQLRNEAIKYSMPIHYSELHVTPNTSGDKQDVKLLVPSDTAKLSNYITLEERKGKEKISLEDGSIIISERLAKSFDVSIGDTIVMQDANNNSYEMKVGGICEMYMGHFAFMNETTYEQVFNQDYTDNAYFVSLHNRSITNANTQAAVFMDLPGVKGIVQNTTLITQIDTIVNALDMIMTVLIIVASLLAVVILYNLTNINISERIRELSTIKVLGFYDKEVTMYIYRETITLTILGILTGFIFGRLLHLYILNVVPPEDVMFDPTTGLMGFIVSIILVATVTFILGIFVNQKLRKEDMLQALKSVD
ncbi:putative ABC transport system permease protein [Breznakia blatticola]|uniref:Putative ABC transport system permease protein n=1 Tax=Breznakia blatticola TaxID=1754012 RepID=A0A4V6Q8E7_9FIRM|nr:FtsX-like permease family protein [Breznakia blatticola]TDW19794.1 putative ABC transport system permease protein [Breznakia blatticola]